jgi:tetratricopeptide (TPR) repeat protein
MQKNIVLVLISFFISLASFSINKKSMELKQHGDTAFMKKEYFEAINLYRQAIDEDMSNYLAYYNIARTMCVLREQHDPCQDYKAGNYEFDLQLNTIFAYLRQSINYSPETIRMMKKDTALECLHSTLEYHMHMGKELNKPVDLHTILPIINWKLNYEDETDWVKPDGKINFTKELRFKLKLYDKEKEVTGKYSISPYHIKMRFDKIFLGKMQIWAIIQKNQFIISGLTENQIIIWNSIEECND